MIQEYKNEVFLNFSVKENVIAMETALAKVDSEKGRYYPLVIGSERIETAEKITSINPSKNDEVIGYSACAEVTHASAAVEAALDAFKTWQYAPAQDRANLLFKTAAIIRRRKFEFSSWLVEEAGKNWAEADGDTAEAIDFLEYYGRQALKMDKGMDLTTYPGEVNECRYIPIGVGLVVSPWNFPLAIMAGMTSAAIVMGNTVVMKPASTTTIIAAKFLEALQEAGMPDGVVNYLPGNGGQIGDYLVSHPKIRFINFTGSKEVGLRISNLAARTNPGQLWIKRVVAEMGGKDSIVVDSEALSLEDAAQGIVDAAFGFQGQKCSACSRAIVVEDVYDQVVRLVAEKANKLKVGPARENGVNMGPVIDEKSYNRILSYIDTGKTEGRVVAGGDRCGANGYFISPTVIADVDPRATIAQEEIFGPVLAIIKAKNYDDALRIANDTEYGLTGAVYTKNRSKLEQARREFHVGNLYFNRKCTGALVGVQPFGGFNMSGTDSKAGGADYLLFFSQAKTVCERL